MSWVTGGAALLPVLIQPALLVFVSSPFPEIPLDFCSNIHTLVCLHSCMASNLCLPVCATRVQAHTFVHVQADMKKKKSIFEDLKIIRSASQTELWICVVELKVQFKAPYLGMCDGGYGFYFLYHNMLTLLLAVLIFHLFSESL